MGLGATMAIFEDMAFLDIITRQETTIITTQNH